MGRGSAARGGLIGVVLIALVFAPAGIVRTAGATTPRDRVALHAFAQGKVAVAVLRFAGEKGARRPRLRLARGSTRGPTSAIVLGTSRRLGRPGSYLGIVSIVNFRGTAQATDAIAGRVVVTADRSFSVDYLGDAETYRGRMKVGLRQSSFREWTIDAYRLPTPAADPRYRSPRTLLDQVRRVAIGAPDPRFLAAVRGTQVSALPPPSPPVPPSPPPTPPPPQPSGLIQLSSDPFTNPSSQHRAQVEPDSFAFGSTIVAAFQSGRFYNGGSSDIGFATSTNNGATWTNGFLPMLTKYVPPSVYDRASDPSVAYDPKHGVWLIASLAMQESPVVSGVAAVVSRSSDGGFTWSAPVGVGAGANIDKEWIVCDTHVASPHYGSCYLEWDDVADGDRIKMSTSSDGGLNWGAARNTVGNAQGFAGQPVVQTNGRVVVPIVSPDVSTLLAFDSSDGGASWSNTRVITSINDHEVAGGLRTEPLPSAEVDSAGTVYVVWQDCSFRVGCSANDLVLTTTTELGYPSWSAPIRVPIDAVSSGADHFIPGLAVDPVTAGGTAKLALAYYYYPQASCSVSTCQLDVGFVSSADGGATWGAASQIAGPMTLGWLPSTTGGLMVGDYISTSFSGGAAHPVFALARAPSNGVLDEAIYTR